MQSSTSAVKPLVHGHKGLYYKEQRDFVNIQGGPMNRQYPFRPIKNIRLAQDLYSHCGQPVFITIRAHPNSVPFQNPALCKMAIDSLLEQGDKLNLQIHVYCLMPDHLHYLISPNEDGISVLEFTNQYKGKTTHLSWDLGWSGKLWQPRFYDHLVRSDESLTKISEYILQNPIRKGWVSTIDEWPWSGIPG